MVEAADFARLRLGLALSTALGAGAVLVILRDRLESVMAVDSLAPAPPSPPVDTRGDSILLVTRGAAEYAREHAVAATVPPAALAAGDSLRTVAESLAAQGNKLDAALLLQRAASFYSSAESSNQAAQAAQAQATPGPVPAPAPPPTNAASSRPTRPATGASPAVPDSQAIAQFYAELEKAVESRQLSEVQRLLPNMSDGEARDWRDFFVDEDIQSLDATYTVQHVTRQGEVVFARVREEVVVHWGNGKSSKKRDDILWTQLTNGPRGWRQIRAGKAPK